MTKDEALRKIATVNAMDYEYQQWAREALAQPEQEPVAWRWETHNGYAYSEQHYEGEDGQPLYTTPPQRTWVGLMRGVRVDGDTVVITVKGGNEAARKLCAELLKEKNL